MPLFMEECAIICTSDVVQLVSMLPTFLPTINGPQWPMEVGTSSPAHGEVWGREMAFPRHIGWLMNSLHLVMEVLPLTAQVHLMVMPGHMGVPILGTHDRSGDLTAQLAETNVMCV